MEEEDKNAKGKFTIILHLVLRAILFPPKLIIKVFFVNKKLLVLFLFILSIATTILIARTKPELLGIPKSQQIVNSQDEVNKLIEEVGKIIVLPEGQIPTVATVTEVEKVKDQAFFARALNGDKVLVYTEAKKAILYRPSEKKIIEVGVVNIGQGELDNKEATGSSTPTSKPTFTPIPTSKPTSTPTPSPTPTFSVTPTALP